MALGFGAVTNATRLGQPLDFTVAVKLDPDEAVDPACVNADVTAGDTHIPPAQVRARLVRSSRATDAFVRIGTTSRVREPVVTVLLSLGCPPRASHKFVSLLDPPLPAALRGDATRAMPGGAPARTSATTPATAPAAMTPSPAPVVVAAADAATPAPAPPDGDDRSRDREQLQALEQRVEVLRQDQQAAQQSVAALQSKLRQMEEGRHDPALYGLATLVVLLLGVIALLLWRQSRARSEDAWLSDSQALTDGGARHSEAQRMSAVSPSFDEVTMTSMRVVPESTYPNPATEPPITTAPESAAPAPQGSGPRARRELTADELIDLEQQADFFIALGQEESAIDLLMSHVRSSGGTSPMPYLKLLEIYRRRGEAEAYERIRERFNRRFNAHAPDWDTDPARGRPLEDYPDIMERLQRAWVTPLRASDLLEALLFRRDPAQAGFDLPAYEELLFLYALARDHVEQDNNPDGVDLLLPMEHGEAPPAILHVAHRTPAPPPPKHPGMDVDVDLDTPGPAPAGG